MKTAKRPQKMKVRRRRKKVGIPEVASLFTEEMLFRTAQDVKSGRWPTERARYTDDVVTGMRYTVNQSGLITVHAAYEVGDFRGLILLGSINKDQENHITIKEARELTKTIQALAQHGVNVQEGLHARLMRELKSQGTSWRPSK